MSLITHAVLVTIMMFGAGMMARLSIRWCLITAVISPIPLLINYVASDRTWESWYPLALSPIVASLLVLAWRRSTGSTTYTVQENQRFVRGAFYFVLPIVILAFIAMK